jgi:gas vesicle protein
MRKPGKGWYQMSGNNFLKGVAVGVAAGAAIGLIAAPNSKDMKKAVGKFLKAAGGVVENISNIWD